MIQTAVQKGRVAWPFFLLAETVVDVFQRAAASWPRRPAPIVPQAVGRLAAPWPDVSCG